MSFASEGTAAADAAALEMDSAPSLGPGDLEQLADLSGGGLNASSDAEHPDEEETRPADEPEDEELVQTDLGAQEIEIETERSGSATALAASEAEVNKPKTLPPLRPLTIAPKPAKLPFAIKPVTNQQLLLVQGNGQQFKIISPQAISLSNFQLGKPLKSSTPKQVVMKKLQPVVTKSPMKTYDNKQVVVVQKAMVGDSKTVTVSASTAATVIPPTPTKTITLAQAHQMGLLTSGKIVTQGAVGGGGAGGAGAAKHAILLNKPQQKGVASGIRLVRSPAKILPAPQAGVSAVGPAAGGGAAVKQPPQRILLKASSTAAAAAGGGGGGGGGGPTVLAPNQLIQVAGGQPIAPGQIHQINLPGKGVQYIKFVSTQADIGTNTSTTSSAKTSQTVAVGSKLVTLSNNSEVGNIVISNLKSTQKTNIIAPKPTGKTVAIQPQALINSTSGQLLMVPATYLHRTQPPKSQIPIRSTLAKMTAAVAAAAAAATDAVVPTSAPSAGELVNLESNGMRPRKPCNCTKSQCLKLYCDCFANGEFCYKCNCTNCYNNLENEEHRQRAIKNCLDRNPNAFRPKIGKSKDTGDTPVRKHTKGCNCKRSGCLKNYCECYEAKIACSSNCKCMGCRNIEETMEKKTVRPQNVEVVFGRSQNQPNNVSVPPENILQIRPKKICGNKQALNSIGVIEATTSCLFAVAGSLEANGENEEDIKGRVIEEFSRCLVEIISTSRSNKNATNH